MKQYTVTGMSCAACSARVEKAVSKVPGVTSCSVSLLTNSMGVEGSATDQEIIKAVVDAANKEALVKVIIETCYLTDEEKKIACELAVKAGTDYVKTSTGFGTGGSTPADIKLMRETVGENIGVKASGGVRCEEDAVKVIDAGATRIGASASIAIVSEDNSSKSDY